MSDVLASLREMELYPDSVLRERIKTAAARIEKLERALRPFSKWKFEDNVADHVPFCITTTVGDLRRADAMLAQLVLEIEGEEK
jgi:hypothetical protein